MRSPAKRSAKKSAIECLVIMPHLTLENHVLHYVTVGDSSNPSLLMLHGFLGSCEDFRAIASTLSQHFYCIIPDLPGHGKTVTTPNCYTFPTTAQALIDILNHLNIPRTHLLGYSMGGRLALYLVCCFPERFNRVVLESASPGLKTADERRLRAGRDEVIAQKIETTPLPTFLAQWYSNPLFASLKNHPKAYAEMLQRRQNNNATELANALRGLSTGRQPSLWQTLKSIDIPLLLLAGTFDDKFVAINRDIFSRMDQKTPPILEVIKECGHNIHLEDSATCIYSVAHFLSAYSAPLLIR